MTMLAEDASPAPGGVVEADEPPSAGAGGDANSPSPVPSNGSKRESPVPRTEKGDVGTGATEAGDETPRRGPGAPSPAAGRPSIAQMLQPQGSQQTSLMVAVRMRPVLVEEQLRGIRKDILRVLDEKMVVVLDPDEEKGYLDRQLHRSKERRYTFDVAFDKGATNQDVYAATAKDLIGGVLSGLNGTVFAYGATGSGKTYTMVGEPTDPGMMLLSLVDIFEQVRRLSADYVFEVTCSYLEVYNELIYDLLTPESASLELREDPEKGAMAVGLRKIEVKNTDNVMDLLREGNMRRKTEPTEANAVSSRSHAVLEIQVKRSNRAAGYKSQVLCGKLALVDLAGSERASETQNVGQKLRDGANINRSLLALANCINALGKAKKGAYVPYRNSKLTRLLKDGLSGNSQTAMVANVSCGADQYMHTINTLKYADRAKEIKTHVVQNLQTVESHISDYQRLIDNLQGEVAMLKTRLRQKEGGTPVPPDSVPWGVGGGAGGGSTGVLPHVHDDGAMSWLDELSDDINENVEERINLQKALFELEDMNIQNKCELVALDARLKELSVGNADAAGGESGGADAETLRERRAAIVENIRDNTEAGLRYRADIEVNEQARRAIQARIDAAIQKGRSPHTLRILSQYRLMGVSNMELHFQLAVRDQIISDQREVISCLWRIMAAGGINQERAMQIAKAEGILVDYDKEGEGPGGVGSGGAGNGQAAATGPLPAPEELAKVHGGGGGVGGANDGDAVVLQTAEVNLLHEKSVVGARAKARFDFWQNYEGAERGSDVKFGGLPAVRRGVDVPDASPRRPQDRERTPRQSAHSAQPAAGPRTSVSRHSPAPGPAGGMRPTGHATDRPTPSVAPRMSAGGGKRHGAATQRDASVRGSFESLPSRPGSQGSEVSFGGVSSKANSRAASRVNSARGDPKPAGGGSGKPAGSIVEPQSAMQQRMSAAAQSSAARRSAALGSLSGRGNPSADRPTPRQGTRGGPPPSASAATRAASSARAAMSSSPSGPFGGGAQGRPVSGKSAGSFDRDPKDRTGLSSARSSSSRAGGGAAAVARPRVGSARASSSAREERTGAGGGLSTAPKAAAGAEKNPRNRALHMLAQRNARQAAKQAQAASADSGPAGVVGKGMGGRGGGGAGGEKMSAA